MLIDRFHSRGLQLCKFLVTKEKLFNTYRTHVVNQHGRRFIVFYTNMAAVTSCENDL